MQAQDNGVHNDPADETAWTEADHLATGARLALSIAAGRMAVWDYDVAADQILGSPALTALLGFPHGVEPTTEEIRSRYYPGEQDRLQAEGRAALARGKLFVESEFRYLWPDGSVHWVLLRAQAIMDDQKRPVRALGVAMDITDRKRTEMTLRASETRLKLAQDAAGIGVWDWDLRSRAISWSPEIYELLDIEPVSERVPHFRVWLQALHPDDRAAATRIVRQAVAEARPFSVDFRLYPRRKTPEKWVRSRGSPVMGEDGRVSRYVGVNLDVTDDHRREERLLVLADDLRGTAAKAERERERISELSNDLFAVVRPDDRILACNPAWSHLLGEQGRDVRGARFIDLIHPADRAITTATLNAVRVEESLERVEARLARLDDGTVWIAWTMSGEDGTVYAVGRDITLDKARDGALVQAQKMEALGQLTGGIAHDFNNLLQAVGGYLEMIRSRPGDRARVSQWADNALLASERGTKLTGQLLAFSRAERIEVAPVLIQDVVTELDDLLRRTLGGMVRISVDLPPEPLGILADRTQFETAMLNLAINARDAMPDGGELTIGVKAVVLSSAGEFPSGEYVEVRTSDTGTGMPPHVEARAFDPFFTTKGVGKGTGLGLSQVYSMAHHAGGTARIKSRSGGGTTITLLLKRVQPPANDRDESTTSSENTLSRATVLVVDDDADVRSLLADMLPALGYAASFAADGPTALARLEVAIPDVMLLDFAMPGMNGAEVSRAALARYPDLRIVLASGHADFSQIDALVHSVPRLRKPFRMGELGSVLATVLSEPTQDPQAARVT